MSATACLPRREGERMTETPEPEITDGRLQGLLTFVKKNAEAHE